MRDDITTQPVLFKDLFEKPLVARFDQPDSSSDGGALLLKACDQRLGDASALRLELPKRDFVTVIDDCRIVPVTFRGEMDEPGDRAKLQIASRSFLL